MYIGYKYIYIHHVENLYNDTLINFNRFNLSE